MKSATLEVKRCEQDVRSKPADFDRLAGIYRWLEWLSFGPFLARCRYAFLAEMNCSRSALILGDGDGRFTARLLNENPSIIVDAVDASPAMLKQLQRRTRPHASRIERHLEDARQFRPLASYDLVVTHFFLDCLSTDEVCALSARIRRNTEVGAKWVISEFAIPDSRLGRALAEPLVSALYWAFACLTGLQVRRLPDHRAALRQAGFILLHRREWLAGLLASELWQADI
jgi:ubiquinone/menaquinone biosynthesis C-methylase UbiE